MAQEEITRFSDTFERSVDAKKRVAVPAGWLSREEGETFYLIPHPSGEYLMAMPPDEFDRWEQRIQASEASAADKRTAVRQFYSQARAVTTDRQGRILLPEKHCEKAGVAGEVTIVGLRSRFEIWSRERREAVDRSAHETYQRVMEAAGL